MPTTTKGLPYPASTAPPNVPADLGALAQDLDFTKVVLLTAAQIPSTTTLLSAYPLGLSLLSLSTTESGNGGWPTGSTGHVLTIKPNTGRGVQYFYRNSASAVMAFYRQLVADPGPHSPWAGGGAPYAQIAGTVTLNAATNPTASVQVNFPAGRFTQAPRITVSPQTPSMSIGVQSATTSAAVFIGRNVATFTSTFTCHWIAVQGLSTDSDG
jgi:hypothetical protein